MKIAMAQMKMDKDPNVNLKKSLDMIEEASKSGADIICFPEIQMGPFFPQYPNLDVSNRTLKLDSDPIKKMRDKCKEHGIMAVPNVYLSENGKCYDASILIDQDGRILGTSKMVHVMQCPLFYEQDYYEPSDTGFKVFKTPIGKIGIIVCFDRHLPESFRACALQGAELIIIPTANTKDEPMEMFEWELKVSAMQNNFFVSMCNRVGLEGEMDFSGESVVINPNGDRIVKAADQEKIVYADIDIDEVKKARDVRPFLSLRRPNVYSKLCDYDTELIQYSKE